MKLQKTYRKLTTALSRFWPREAGPMNWKNPVRVTAYIGWEIFNGVAFLVGEWVRYGVRASQIFLAIPPTVILFVGGVWFAVWSFVRRPFPALETVPLLDLLEYHNPTFYSAVVVWYYLSPLVVVLLAGSIALSVWKVWLEARKRDLLPFGALPAWPLFPEQHGPEIVIGEVHHPVEERNGPIIDRLPWRLTSMFTSAIRTVHGNVVPMKIPMACFDSTSRKEPTYRCTRRLISTRSLVG